MRCCMTWDSWSKMKSQPGTLWLSHKACIQFGWCTSLSGHASFCPSWRSEMQQSWRPNRQQQDQASELSVGQQQLREEEQKEDCNYAPPRWELKTASFPCLQIEATQHHHWCTRGVVTGDGDYNVQDCREQK